MPNNNYVTLGCSGLRVSPFCLGAMTFGEEWGFGADERVSTQIIDRYLDWGGNFIDTANLYTAGHSERILGDYFSRDRGKRHRGVIATKFSANMHSGDPNGGGANRKSIMAACDASLERLRTDYIDLYWQHWDDPFTPMEETMSALDDLVRAGKVRYIGVSNTPAWRVAASQVSARFQGCAPFIALQIEYSLLERTVEGELIPMAEAMGLGITPWSPLRSGFLTGKYSKANINTVSSGRGAAIANNDNDPAYAVLDVLSSISQGRGASVAQVALAWLRSRPGVSSIIIGARTVAQLNDNLASLDVELALEEIERLDRVSAPRLNFPAEFLPRAVTQSNSGFNIDGRSFRAVSQRGD